ncbi:AI-2E family transporter [Sphingomicrobium sediminis]|uniref:AI-2E family transporter n=1 Tax=Sphingomicrobium sediminis TaxID=2950949 RepID=A0A9X2EKI4_9SPHN|nr:AI-2E family transporter [Sphingomicrobium sediminis]MCM8557057.1 AI-2E family transporter [Sphingomicrobium sediminis]
MATGLPDEHIELQDSHTLEVKRVRLLAGIALALGLLLVIALPFALSAGAEFFLPVTAALVIAIALVPLLEWFERRGVPSALASILSLFLFIMFATFVIASIVLPAIDYFALIPERIDRIRETVLPFIQFYAELELFIENALDDVALTAGSETAVAITTPDSVLDLFATSAPVAIIQMFFGMLVIFFFLSRWTKMRERTITSRGSFEGALTTARVIQQVVDATSTYIGTITFINVTLGTIVALALWAIGMDSPIMWGGIVAVTNFIPYLGPILSALLLAVGGLMSFVDPWAALLPPIIFIVLHNIEANLITPMVVGKRVSISPLLILISLSFWAWIWGVLGALLAVPLLIIIKTIFAAAGTPDIAGFLFEHGTLTHVGEDEEKES